VAIGEIVLNHLVPGRLCVLGVAGRSIHRILMLEVVGIGGHPGAGGSH
jgi:hypothetical protein